MHKNPLPAVAALLLHTLLDRAEQPGRQQVIRVRLVPAQHPDYFSPEDVAPRQQTNQIVQQLADAGALRLHWQKWEQGNWLEALDLLPERASDLYHLLQRQPRTDQVADLLALLDTQHPPPGWYARFLAGVRDQIAAGRAPTPLVLGDAAFNADLLRLLGTLAELQAPILERSLSTRLFGDSKRLEELRSPLLSVLRGYAPDAASFAGDDAALLRAYGIERTPEYIPLAGPLILQPTQGAAIDLAHFSPSLALSAAMLRQIDVAACSATRLLTVENATSFTELLALRPPDLLLLYTGGFASPTLLVFLRSICQLRPDLPVYHWGDLDAGGLRILAHLRTHLGAISPLAMDVATLRAYQHHAKPLTSSDQRALLALKSQPLLADCLPLITTLLELGCKLEQEALDVRTVVGML
ncbi:Wadjet anti-phage system protein JetD domain-containing protein [Candidatus Oscillochloris fontis]|uniref:Wadjet anti-phage system protein JetD domain-containing protein n=1 Tax=Candidatus Oscillochloris fontis TaxID=2496868 RepID=UPI001375FAA2|nr:Wadjet anti-phage system protein JetD domain-containing protein [Candidatus Oscillochloris fontis]